VADDFETAVREINALIAADLEEDVRASGHLLVDLFDEAAPVRSGRFRGSLEVSAGDVAEGDGLTKDLPFYTTPGHDLFDAAMEGWQPGVPLTFADQVPYAERLANGYSPQASTGWVDVITEHVASRK
jgi:hypothetical protein